MRDPGADRTTDEPLAELRALRARVAALEDTAGAREAEAVATHRRAAVLDAAPALMAYVDTDGYYRLANARYAAWFGRPREQIVGRHVREVVGETSWALIRQQVERALAGEALCFEVEVDGPTGTPVDPREPDLAEPGARRPVQAMYTPHLAPTAPCSASWSTRST